MRGDDIKVLQGVQKNTDMAMKAIESISSKVYDDELAVQISRQGMKYAEIYNKANCLTPGRMDIRAAMFRI